MGKDFDILHPTAEYRAMIQKAVSDYHTAALQDAAAVQMAAAQGITVQPPKATPATLQDAADKAADDVDNRDTKADDRANKRERAKEKAIQRAEDNQP